MKKYLIIAILSVLSIAVNAQSRACQEAKTFSVKPFAGLSIGTFNGTNCESVRNALVAGAEGQYMLNNCVGLSLGVAYSQQGAKYRESDYKMTGKLDYINVPMLVNFYLFKGFAVKTGLQPGFNIKKSLTVTSSEGKEITTIDDNVRPFDISIPMGVSYEIAHVVFDLRFNVGLIGIFKDYHEWGDENYLNEDIQLTVGYRF